MESLNKWVKEWTIAIRGAQQMIQL